MSNQVLHLLLVEDSRTDAELVTAMLRREGFALVCERVDCAHGLRDALMQRHWDVVLIDYRLPGYSALEAMRLVKERDGELPVILVSGSEGEMLAVEAMRAGAQDYVLKGQLARLGFAVRRALREASLRRQSKQSEFDLVETVQRLRTAVRLCPLPMVHVDRVGGVMLWNPAATDLFGWTEDEILGSRVPQGPGARGAALAAALDGARAGHSLAGATLEACAKSGRPIDMLMWTKRDGAPDASQAGVVAVFVERNMLSREGGERHDQSGRRVRRR